MFILSSKVAEQKNNWLLKLDMTVDVGLSSSVADKAKAEMTVETSANEEFDSKKDSEQKEEERAKMTSTTPPTSAPSSTANAAANRPKFMITDILRNDSPQVHYPPAPMPHHHQFYPFNLFGFNPMMPPLLFGPGHLMAPAGSTAAVPPESSPRDLSFKRSASAAHLDQHPDDDEDEYVDPDGSDHERDSPIGKADLMLSDDDSDICKSLNSSRTIGLRLKSRAISRDSIVNCGCCLMP